MEKNWVMKKEVKAESLKTQRCVRRILQVSNVTRAQATVGAEEMEKNLQVREILGEIWTVLAR